MSLFLEEYLRRGYSDIVVLSSQVEESRTGTGPSIEEKRWLPVRVLDLLGPQLIKKKSLARAELLMSALANHQLPSRNTSRQDKKGRCWTARV